MFQQTRTWILRAAVAASFLTASLATTALAETTYQLTPLDLGSGYTVAGTITTDGTLGPLVSANITRWNVSVTYTNDTVYTPGNTSATAFLTQASPTQLTVDTFSLDGFTDGGTLAFIANEYFGVTVADFSSFNYPGGAASWQQGSSVNLNQSDGVQYTAATSATGTQYDLIPIDLGAPYSMFGHILTDGTVGPINETNILDWSITVREQSEDLFDENNSTISAFSNITATPTELLADNPDGELEFLKGIISLHKWSIQLADFVDPDNQAGYFYGRLFNQISSPLSGDASYILAISDEGGAIPEPTTLTLLGLGVAGLLGRRQQKCR